MKEPPGCGNSSRIRRAYLFKNRPRQLCRDTSSNQRSQAKQKSGRNTTKVIEVGNGKNLLRKIWKDWKHRSQYEGQGISRETAVIPSDPVALVDRLDLLLDSKAAGNTGVRNELVSVCDELLTQKVMN